jgi:hypothetical protein
MNKAMKDDWIFGEDDNQTGDDSFARNTIYNQTKGFGFGSDNNLGVLAEINKSQMQQAMGNLNQFGRTEYAAHNRRGFFPKNNQNS